MFDKKYRFLSKNNKDKDNRQVCLPMTLADMKILHNLCIDCLLEHPNMIGYENIKNKLQVCIDLTETDFYEPDGTDNLPYQK